MTETATGPGPGEPSAPPRIGDELRSLRRSSSDRVVAGVLGGLGRRLGVDPVVLRVVTAVLAVFGGVGVLLYALAWLLVPADDQDASVLEHALGRGAGGDATSIPLAIGLGVAVLIATGAVVGGNFVTGALLVLTVAGLVVMLRRDDDGLAPPTEPDPLAWQPGASYEPPTTPATAAEAAAASDAAGAELEKPSVTASTPAATRPTAGVTTPFVDSESTGSDQAGTAQGDQPGTDYPGGGWPEGPDWGTAHLPQPPEPFEQPAPPAPRQRSVLTPITVFTAIVAVGVLAVNDATWASIPAAMYIAVPLAIVGVGLLLGTWFGRARGLVVLGILLTLALAPTTVVERWDDGMFGPDLESTVVVTSLAQVPSSPVEIGAGSTTYDLSRLTPAQLTAAENGTIELTIEQGAGELRVIVPPTADVTVDASVGAGDLNVFDQGGGGLGTERTVTDYGRDGPGGGTIELTLELGTGELEVTR